MIRWLCPQCGLVVEEEDDGYDEPLDQEQDEPCDDCIEFEEEHEAWKA